MAEDKMIFPIGFDLKAAVDSAIKDWDGKEADRLEKAIQKRALEVKLQVKKLDTTSLEEVKKRLGELKIEPITPETKTAIKELAAELRTLARALQEVQKYSTRAGGTPEAVRNSKILANEAKASAARELARQRAARAALAEDKLAAARERAGLSAERNARRTQKASQEFKNQDGYVGRLVKRLAVYASFSAINNFLTSVREVTAQFELQRISLGAIIQDQVKANALFAEIKQFALKSPVSIMDMTKYTKQLAAYKFETEELFDWTKRLTDISVGLSVPMERIVLLAGQVRATGWLRGSEIRQATEAGIPLVEELASKLSKINGELVTAKDVMDMVSKRQITWEMVADVFRDMTSAGGMFYNMQEKQGNTLFGLWAKLGDAASVMYDEIGNTDRVNSAMKSTIEMLTALMRNWREAGRTMALAGGIFGANFIIGKVKGWQGDINAAKIAANEKYIAASNVYRSAIQAEQAARMSATAEEYKAIAAKTASAEAAYTAARAEYLAIRNTTLWGKAIGKLKSFVVGNWITLLIAGIAAVAMHFYNAYEKANKLKNALKDIEDESNLEQLKSVRNFETLAKTAVEAADGSKKQKDALDELNRTYKDIIPQERLTIENLREMDGSYERLTQSIRTYIAEQMKQKKISTIIEQTGKTIVDEQRDVNNFLSKQGYSDAQIGRFWIEYENLARTTNKSVKEMFAEAWKAIGGTDEQVEELYTMYRRFGGDMIKHEARLKDITIAYRDQEKQIARVEAQYDSNYMALGRYGQGYEDLVKKLNDNPIKVDGAILDANKDSYLYGQQKKNLEVLETIVPTLQKIMSDAKVAWQDGWANLVDTIDTANPQIVSTIDFDAINKYLSDNIKSLTDEQRKAVYKLQEIYNGISISDRTVLTFRSKLTQLSIAAGVEMGSMTKYFMNAGDKIEDYAKRIKEAIEDLDNQIKEMNGTNQMIAEGKHGPLKGFSEEEIKKIEMQVAVLKELFPFLQGFTKSSGRTPADPRLQTLQEIANKMAEVNKEYDELLKKEGQTKALADTQKLFASSFEQMSKTAKKYGFKLPAFEVPQTIEDVQKWYKAIADEIQRLGLKNADKVLIELGFKSDKAAIDKQQKDIEEQLKSLADRISRTKTAKEFYEKILSMTGDVELAANISLQIYGSNGRELDTQIKEQMRKVFELIDKEGKAYLDPEVSAIIDRGAYEELRDYISMLPEAQQKAAEDLVKAQQQMSVKQYETWLKDLEKAKEYADKRIELARYTADQIAEIEAKQKMLDPNDANYKAQMAAYEQMIRGYREREKNEAAKLDYEQVKEQIGMFDDLGVRIGSAFEQILANLKAYTQSPDFARLGLETQKNVYSQIAKIEDRMTEGFQGIGIGTVSEYVREYSSAASEYLTAQNELKNATLAAIEADRAYNEAKKSGNQATIDAALAEKQLADSRVASATTAVNTAGANLQRTQSNAARASEKFNSNLQKVESSLKSLNNGALRALWDLLGDKGKRSVGEFLSGSYKMVDAIDKLTKALADSGSDMGKLSKSIVDNLATALSSIDPEDSEAIAQTATESLKQTLSSVINDKGVVELLSKTLSKNIGEIASQALSGVLSTEDAVNKVGALIDGIADAASSTGEMWGAIISLVLSLLDEFAENGIGTFLGELLDNIGEAVEGILANLLTESLPKIIGSVGNVVKGVGVGLADMLTLGAFDLTGQKRVKRANKEIERQQKLLDQLEYTYGRLEKAADKAFGGDYVSNINAQKRNMEAQIAAYEKQLAAENSKGKKKDKNKIKEYQETIRDTKDALAELETQVAENMLGSSLQDKARDVAKAWLEAYKTIGRAGADTTEAMKEQFQDMVENMVVEGALAKVMERALKPMFDTIDNMGEQDFYSESFWKNVSSLAEQGAKDADYGAQTMMKFLEQAGISMRDLGGDFTGMAKDVANASSEEILANTNALNTQNFYISQILDEVRLIRSGRAGDSGTAMPSLDYTPLIQQSLENQAMMVRYQAETLAECKTIAKECVNQTDCLRRVVFSDGNKHKIRVGY